MKTFLRFLGALMAAGLLLSACSGENALDNEPLSEAPTGQDVENLHAPEFEVDEPEALTDLAAEIFSPTLTSFFEQSYAANPVSDRDYSQYEIITLLPKDGIPALSFPSYYKAERADREYDPDEIVIGIEFNGDARAYPIDLLSRHEIVNDEVGGIKLAITW